MRCVPGKRISCGATFSLRPRLCHLNVFIDKIFLTFIASKLLYDGGVHFVEQMLISGSLVVEVFILVAGLIRLKHEDVSVTAVVENNLFNYIFSLENALLVREFCNVDRRLGVVGTQFFVNGFFLLLLGEVLLLVSELVCVIHVKELVIVLQVFRHFILYNLFLGRLLSFLGGSGRHSIQIINYN